MPLNLIKVEPPDIAIPVDTILISVVSIFYVWHVLAICGSYQRM